MKGKIFKDIVESLGELLDDAEVSEVNSNAVTVTYSFSGIVFNTRFMENGKSYTTAKINGNLKECFEFDTEMCDESLMKSIYKHFLGKKSFTPQEAKMLVKRAQEAFQTNDPFKKEIILKEIDLYRNSDQVRGIRKIINLVLEGYEVRKIEFTSFCLPEAFPGWHHTQGTDTMFSFSGNNLIKYWVSVED